MAAPHVAGLAALTLSANSNLTAASLRNIIVQSSDGSAAGSDANGIVNASLAIPQSINGGTQIAAASTSLASNSSTFGSRGMTLSVGAGPATLAQLPDLSVDDGVADKFATNRTNSEFRGEDSGDTHKELASTHTRGLDQAFGTSAEWLG